MKTTSRLTLALAVWLLAAAPAAAQVTGGVISVRDSSSGAVVPNVGDDANDSIRVSIVAGGGSGGTSSSFGSAFPASGTASGFSDGTNMQGARVFDMDTGGGAQHVLGVGIRGEASGGSVAIEGTTANGLEVDVTRVQGTVAVTQSGTWTVQPGNTANTTAWLVKELRAATATLSNTAASASSVTVLSSNANRLGATIVNDSTVATRCKFGATASSTSYTYKIDGGGVLEVPFGYTGVIDCIWDSASGNARATELTQ
jgi:hypothetical protein